MLNLLLANDDGYLAQGIQILAQHLRALGHKVTVVAPAGERSAQSHAMSFYHPIQVDKIDENTYSVHGTPADCVAIGLGCILKQLPPDFVISGINHGLNVGIDVNYSGTVGAATEASLMGVKAIAVSADTTFIRQDSKKLNELFAHAASMTGNILAAHQKIDWPKFQILNLNAVRESKGLRVARCGGESLYVPDIEEIYTKKFPQTKLYCIGGTKRFEPNDMSQDVSLVTSGFSTMSFIQAKQSSTGFDMTLKQFETK